MKLDELAKLAGVSRTTASYVVNGKAKEYRVSERTIARVQALIKQYDFKPNAIAAGLRAGKSNTVGMIIPDFENISYAKIANLLENRCREKGYQLLITCSNDIADNETDCAKHLLQRQVDRLIVSTCLDSDSEFYQQQSVPVVGFDRHITSPNVQNVLSDDETDARQLAEHLLQRQDYQRVLFLGALPDLAMSQERQRGFEQGAKDFINKVDFLYATAFKKDCAAEAFAQWLSQNSLPDAIFTTSLTLLQGVINVLLKQSHHIPENLVFATFGESELVSLLNNPVVCCVQDHHSIVQALVDIVTSDKKKATNDIIKIMRHIRLHRW